MDFANVQSAADKLLKNIHTLLNQQIKPFLQNSNLLQEEIKQMRNDLANHHLQLQKAKEQEQQRQQQSAMSNTAAVTAAVVTSAATTTIANQSATANASAIMENKSVNKRGSVNFSIRDLRALKEKTQQNASNPVVAEHNSAINQSAIRELVATELEKTSKSSNSARNSEDANAATALPDGWKEYIDPKTNRPFYVNK